MEHDIFSALGSEGGIKVHYGIFTALILGGLGFPIPEDIPLILAGVFAARKLVAPETIFLTCYAGVLIADQMIFFVGYFFGRRLLYAGTKSRFFPKITRDRVNEVREGLRKRRLLYIFLSRHLFPVRSVTFLTAGTLRIPFLEFLVADALAALVSVSIMLSVGYFLGESLTQETIQHISNELHWYAIGLVAVCLLGYFANRAYNRRKKPVVLDDSPEEILEEIDINELSQ